jgi:16S rRNA (uracil1498-N3)-methyltransferase
VTVRIEERLQGRESRLAIHLAMAVINLEKFELVLQKATELGVHSIIPMVTDRVEIRPERYRGKTDRWEKIVQEAVKQSGRAVLPPLEAPAPFEAVIGRSGVRILFDADNPPGQAPSSLESVTVLIGPEGGFSEDEIRRSIDHGCLIQRLGPRRLRAETAAIAATAVLAARYGDI